MPWLRVARASSSRPMPSPRSAIRERPALVSVAVMGPSVDGSAGGAGDGRGGVQDGADDLGRRTPSQPLDRARDRHRTEHTAGAVAHRRGQRGDPGLPLSDAVRPAAPAHVEQRPSGEAGRRQQGSDLVGGGEGEQRVRGRARRQRQPRTDRHRVAQAVRPLGGGDADPRGAVPDVELGALPADVAEGDQVPLGELGHVGAAACQLAQPGAGRPDAALAALDQPVSLQGHGQPVRRRAGQPGAFDQVGERGRLLRDGPEDGHCFVQNGNGVRLSHTAILASHTVRSLVPGDTVPKTLAEKVYDAHVVRSAAGEPDLLYIDLHLVHEVTSPQAFDGLRAAGRTVRHPELTMANEDHNVPTLEILKPIADPVSRAQVEALRKNAAEFGIRLAPMGDRDQGIVHVIGPQLGLTQPGMTIVCGDSHTSTHGAFGALAFGIGTSEVEHVLATQPLPQYRPKQMAVTVDGELPPGVSAKDIILAVIARIGTGGGQGHVIEYRGSAIEALSMEARMTICNMSIEAGAKAGLIAPDQTTFDFLQGRPHAPQGADWDAAVEYWRTLRTDEGAVFDREVHIDASSLTPFVTWGTNPGQGLPIDGSVPDPADIADEGERRDVEQALAYMGLTAGTPLREIKVDTVFLGSCTNGRIEDLRVAADLLRGRHIDPDTRMLVVPGSVAVKAQAEAEGLDRVFLDAGAEWRGAGCSMCLGMNPDQLKPGERSASTSNRNFQGRQGKGGRTHLVSPSVAAATALTGKLTAPADLKDTVTA